MGDSISTFEGCVPDGYTLFYNDERLERSGVLRPEDTWWSHAVRALGGTVLADSAWSGSMVEGAGFPAASSPERAAALLGPDGQAPDAVLVFIGINDYGWGRRRGAGRRPQPRHAALHRPGNRSRADSRRRARRRREAFWRGVPNHVAQHPCGRP